MGYQLWMSATTGYRRNGTRFDALRKIFFDSVTVKEIFEPLLSCKSTDSSFDVRYALTNRNFDMVGVLGENDKVIGCVYKSELKEDDSVSDHIKNIDDSEIIIESTPLATLLNILLEKTSVYISKYDNIVGIVNRFDVDKPPVRIYVFGMLSLFEMHLSFWVKRNYKNSDWENKITKKRLRNAKKLLKQRVKKDEFIQLIDCLQLGDKKNILAKTPQFISELPISRRKFTKLLEKAEDIRNGIAHSQNSIISILDWTVFVNTLTQIEELLLLSDDKLEAKYQRVNYEDNLIPILIK